MRQTAVNLAEEFLQSLHAAGNVFDSRDWARGVMACYEIGQEDQDLICDALVLAANTFKSNYLQVSAQSTVQMDN